MRFIEIEYYYKGAEENMGIHEFNAHALPDTEFVDGKIKYIVNDNKCRLLDGRRTPGYIE